MTDDYAQRYREMVAHWEAEGHPAAGCSGHTYAPSYGCPAPEVHERLRPADPRMRRWGLA